MRLPAALKQILLDEHTATKKGLRLPPLPRKPSVADILDRYIEDSREERQIAELEEQVTLMIPMQMPSQILIQLTPP